MSQENVDIVLRLFEHWQQGDWRWGGDVFDERCEVVFSASWFPDAGEYRIGSDALRAWTAFTEAFETVETRLDQIVDAGDQVVLVSRTRARGRASGADVDALTAAIFTLREKKIVRYVLTDARDALEAVGLRE